MNRTFAISTVVPVLMAVSFLAPTVANARTVRVECSAWTSSAKFKFSYHGVFGLALGRLDVKPEYATVSVTAQAISGPSTAAALTATPEAAGAPVIFSTTSFHQVATDLFAKVVDPQTGTALGKFRIILPGPQDDKILAQLDPNLAGRIVQGPFDIILEADGADVQTYRFDLGAVPWRAWKADQDAFFANAPDLKSASGDDPQTRHCAIDPFD